MPVSYYHVDKDALAPAVYPLLKNTDNPVALIVPDLSEAESLYSSISLWGRMLSDEKHRFLMIPEENRGKIELAGAFNRKIRTLSSILQNTHNVFVGSVCAFANPTAPKSVFAEQRVVINLKKSPGFSELLKMLVDYDYDDEIEVRTAGEFSRRGGVIDIFSVEENYPVRLEFWGEELDSMRIFDPETQRSVQKVDSYVLCAKAKPSENADEFNCTFDYLAEDCEIVVYNENMCSQHLLKYASEASQRAFSSLLKQKRKKNKLHTLVDFDMDAESTQSLIAPCFVPLKNFMELEKEESQAKSYELMKNLFFEQIRHYVFMDYNVVILSSDEEHLPQLKDYCSDLGKETFSKLDFGVAVLNCGVVFPQDKLILLSENELFNLNIFARKTVMIDDEKFAVSRRSDDDLSLDDIAENDVVVHVQYGIAIFCGMEFAKDAAGVVREMIKLEFADEQYLKIPVSQSSMLSRYMGSPGKVRLSRLNSAKWNNDKTAAQLAIKSFAAEMLQLQAVRKVLPGISMQCSEFDMKLFLSEFPYTDTPDQAQATVDIRNDMTKPEPMDRLLCGDVGYGKTEVAMRAAFIAVQAGYQVAVLAPTTILVEQHYESFAMRFARYPFIVESLSRFKTPMQQADILSRLAQGKIDIIIGTHALCSSAVHFKKLGLLIIDEEQRFGVKHKEKLRSLRTEIDVLSMSATPIPRTLYLAMSGARDLSTLITPPNERLPVKTMIAPYNEKTICDAVNHEMSRSGQVFYLHNRVKTIDETACILQSMLPDCRIAVAHGQMAEKELESVMNDFQHGKIDCLVASTIIESGLDIPNANTIIIERADRFGLAQLYQLRGRVGRWKHQAYAYMLLPKNGLVSGDGQKRINAIRRCSNLGAGFQLALRDLEIRGSGNILGTEQSGYLNTIGFDLYCKMLRNEVDRMQNKPRRFLPEAEVGIDFLTLGVSAPPGKVVCGFPPSYIENETLRIGAYRKLSIQDSEESLQKLHDEFCDRFGKMPECAELMFTYTLIKLLASERGFRSVSLLGEVLSLSDGQRVYRKNDGRLPRISLRNPVDLRLALIIRELKGIPCLTR
ncbi:MAG: transcription-repair coupling factor [Lentisphaeria bacterium]|nr:transcription-repair coupling factor [Lentisphaeria bacterium]